MTADLRDVVLGGRFGERSQQVSDELVEHFAARGGRRVETAHAYASGGAERAVRRATDASGVALRIITKVGHPTGSGGSTLGAGTLRRQIATSADRLGRRIDMVMLHRDDPGVPVERLVEPLAEAVRGGLAHEVGLSNWSLGRAEQARVVLGDMLRAISLQFSAVVPRRPIWPGTRAAGAEDLRWSTERGLELLAWSPLARGWIPEPGGAPPEARAAFASDANSAMLEGCDALARAHGCARSVVALAGVLASGDNIRPVVGAERPEELDDAADAVALAASDERGELRALFAARRSWREGAVVSRCAARPRP
jgi:1-deoxyxylulose-5-phosphate synthase